MGSCRKAEREEILTRKLHVSTGGNGFGLGARIRPQYSRARGPQPSSLLGTPTPP